MVQCNRLKTIESAVASLDSRFDGIICARPAQITEAQTGIEAHISAACQDCAICKELQ